jgi:hypothetical protein
MIIPKKGDVKKMVKKIEVADRKLTTSAGLTALAELVGKLESKMVGDLHNFESKKTFFCRVDDDNGLMTSDYNYASWTLTEGKYAYKDGRIVLVVGSTEKVDGESMYRPNILSSGKYHNDSKTTIYDEEIEKIDFAGAVDALIELATVYTAETRAKDEEIERFLKFSEEYLKA